MSKRDERQMDAPLLVFAPLILAQQSQMMDQYRLSLPDRQVPFGSGSRSNAGVKRRISAEEEWSTGHVDIIALVRSLQRTAGMTDCFRMGNVDCDFIDCDWRSYCLGKPVSSAKK